MKIDHSCSPRSRDLRVPERLRAASAHAACGNPCRVPLAVLARFSGLSRRTINYARDGRLSRRTEVLLNGLLSMLERGEFGFERHGRQWRTTGTPPQVLIRKRPYRRRRPGGDKLRAQGRTPMTRESLVLELRRLTRDNPTSLADIARNTGLPTPVVSQAVQGLMSFNTFEAIKTYLISVGY